MKQTVLEDPGKRESIVGKQKSKYKEEIQSQWMQLEQR